MKAENDAKAKKSSKALTTRRGVILITVLAVLILVVNIVTASFSWFTPESVDGVGMAYTATTFNRSENCSFSTTAGKKLASGDLGGDNKGRHIDEIVYGSDAGLSAELSGAAWSGGNIWTDSRGKAVKATVAAGQTMYFETSVVNDDTLYPSDVSVYFASFGAADCKLDVAVIFPSNTVRKVSEEQTDFCLLRNAYVKLKDDNDVDGPGILQIEWFVKNNSSSSVTILLGPESAGGENANMYLMYN